MNTKRPKVWRRLAPISVGLIFNGSRQVREIYEAYGPVFEFGFTRARVTVLSGRAARELISSRRADAFLKQDPHFSVFEDIMGSDYSLPYAEGALHRAARQPFNRGLSWSQIDPRWPQIDQSIRQHIADLVGIRYSGRGSEFIDLVSGAAVADGVGFIVDDEAVRLLRKTASAFLRAATRRRPKWTMRTPAFRRHMAEVERVLVSSISQRSTDSDSCALAQLQKRSATGDPDFPPSQLHWHVAVPYFAALETLPATLTQLVFQIFNDPVLRSTISAEASNQRPPTFQRGMELADQRPAIRSAIREILRYRPLGYLVEREVVGDFEFQGYSFRPGEKILVNTTSEHYDPQAFADRFTYDGCQHSDWNEDRVTAFGAGPRRCPGRPLSLLVQLTVIDELAANYSIGVQPGRLGKLLSRLHPDGIHVGYRLTLEPKAQSFHSDIS